MADQSTVTIHFDLNRNKAPRWSAKPRIDKIPWGETTHIVWQLVAGAGAPDTAFPPQGAIRFSASAAYPDQWPNPQPEPVPTPADQPLLQYQAMDPNYGSHKEPIAYKYTVTVVSQGYLYSWDPEIENESGGG